MKEIFKLLKCVKPDRTINGYYHKNKDAGYDMYAAKDTWIFPLKVKKVLVNLKCEIPSGFFGLLTSRSGESSKGNFVIPGIIDPTYRGQLSAIMTRIGIFPKKIKKGTRIAQLIFIPFEEYTLVYADKLSESERNEKGFGSTGIV